LNKPDLSLDVLADCDFLKSKQRAWSFSEISQISKWDALSAVTEKQGKLDQT
jgi:hypothetical protein